MQLIRTEKAAVRKWTQKSSADSDLHVEHNRPPWHTTDPSRNRNIIQVENVGRSVMPVELKMPIAEAELNFHGYVSADTLYYYSDIQQNI